VSSYFDDSKVLDGLARQSLRSGAITIGARAANATIQVSSILLLARLLTPEDYGLVTMVSALIGFAPALVDLGTRDAVVQRSGLTEGEASTLFWLILGLGCAGTLVVSASGVMIAAFYGEPRLTGIVFVSSLAFLLVGLTAQHQALLRRAMMFRQLAVIDVVASLLSAGGAIAMALVGFGYWALVVRPVAMYGLTAIGTWWSCRWLPGRPIATGGVAEMLRFGLHLCGFSVTDFVARNADRVAVGRGLGARALGYYQSALLVYDNLLDVLIFPLHQVAVSGLSRLQDDHEELRRAWAKALSTVAFCAMPAFGVLAVTSSDLIVLLLGTKWATAGALLSVLALRGIPHSIERTLGWLHVAAGRTDRWFLWGILAAVVQLTALLFGLRYGPFGVVWALTLSMYLLFVPAIVYAGRPLGIRSGDVIRAIGAQVVGALAGSGAGFAARVWLLSEASTIERMGILVLLYVMTYLVVVVGLFRVTMPLQVCRSMLNDIIPKAWKSRLMSQPSAASK
jgi:polysaccharide transporter, PST family